MRPIGSCKPDGPNIIMELCLKNNIFQIFFFSWIPVYFMLNYFGWETTHMWWYADGVTCIHFLCPFSC